MIDSPVIKANTCTSQPPRSNTHTHTTGRICPGVSASETTEILAFQWGGVSALLSTPRGELPQRTGYSTREERYTHSRHALTWTAWGTKDKVQHFPDWQQELMGPMMWEEEDSPSRCRLLATAFQKRTRTRVFGKARHSCLSLSQTGEGGTKLFTVYYYITPLLIYRMSIAKMVSQITYSYTVHIPLKKS